MQSCSYAKHMWGLRIPTIYRRAARENVNSFSILHTMKQQAKNFADLRIAATKTSGCKFLRRRIQGYVGDLFVSLFYLKMSAGLIESFLVLGPDCNNVIGPQNRVCRIESSCLHRIFNYHCDSTELSKRLGCWNLEQLPVEFGSLCYSRCSSNHRFKLQRFDSRSIRVGHDSCEHVVCCNSSVTQLQCHRHHFPPRLILHSLIPQA